MDPLEDGLAIVGPSFFFLFFGMCFMVVLRCLSIYLLLFIICYYFLLLFIVISYCLLLIIIMYCYLLVFIIVYYYLFIFFPCF